MPGPLRATAVLALPVPASVAFSYPDTARESPSVCEAVPEVSSDMASAENRVVVDFREPATVRQWASIDDVVMGGRSSSRLEWLEGEGATFAGSVSLEDNGGFASVRSAPGRHDLGPYTGIALRLRGDGKRYKLNLRTDPGLDGVSYRVRFPTEEGAWKTIHIPFSDFEPRRRGRPVSEADPLDPGAIVTFGFLISDRQEGPFRLDVAWIAGWR